MKTIQVTRFKSSELNPEFSNVSFFEVDDRPFDSGAFGEVYHCTIVNGKKLNNPQVLKFFLDDGSGSAERGFATVNKLQEQIINHNLYLKQGNNKAIEEINALKALPQFTFEGILNGNIVLGYSANLLSNTSWLKFGDIFNEEDLNKRKELRNRFYNLPIDHRLKMAYDLAEGFMHLGQMKFIYADLNPNNFFINENDGELCLIDFEGGAVNENPETYGKPGEWLAPEIQEQLLNGTSSIIKVDLNTDTWAVAIAIHFMLFQFHPLFFMKVRGQREVAEYFRQHQWPIADKDDKNFRTELGGVYDWYINKLNTQIPRDLVKAFAETINRGYKNPSYRLSYKQWINAIKGLMVPPILSMFETSSPFTIDGVPVTLTWNIDDKAHTVLIDNGVGDVTEKKEIKVRPQINTTYTLKAIGHFGEVEQSVDVKVFPTPIIESLLVPLPDLTQTYNIDSLKFQAINIDFSVNINEENLSEVSDMFFREKPSVFSLSKIINQIKTKASKL